MEADLLLKARWIVPVDPEGRVLEAHALAVRDGAIVDVLPSAEADLRWRAREVLSLDRHVLIPGSINAHTHAAMALFRGLADDLPLMDWLTRHIWPAEQRWVADEFVRRLPARRGRDAARRHDLFQRYVFLPEPNRRGGRGGGYARRRRLDPD